eukprot:5894488-Amphidinium_carterae.1
MPPVESLKALVSYVMTQQTDKHGNPLVLAVYDVWRAHFYSVCVCVRDVYVKPPEERHREGFLAKLNKTMYRTQDASNVWQKTWGDHLQENSFELAAATPPSFSQTYERLLSRR